MEEKRGAAEAIAQEAWNEYDFEKAAAIVIEEYGPEIYTFLVAHFRGDIAQADDVFSDFCEDFWRSISRFQWRCSIRSWCYRLARNASSRFRQSFHNRAKRRVTLDSSQLCEVAIANVRSRTQPYLRSDVKDQFQQLRQKLDPDDEALLILRVDRDLSWREVVYAMEDAEEIALDEELLRRKEAAVRQRFVEVKKRLRRLAEEAGLL
jgi:RNA polymerase sigma-70 factor (ECF subfamily)